MAIFLGLGSNEGNRSDLLRRAFFLLEEHGVTVVSASPLYETEPWGKKDQPWFLNCCVEVTTNATPEGLLSMCEEVEQRLGRDRSQETTWGPRPIDIDILFYNDAVLQSQTLIIPHPALHQRRFVLQPLCDIAPRFLHPIFKKTVQLLLKECSDTGIVRPYAAQDHLGIEADGNETSD